MQESSQYTAFAEECERLAREMPQHAEVLLRIAQAWRDRAREAARREGKKI